MHPMHLSRFPSVFELFCCCLVLLLTAGAFQRLGQEVRKSRPLTASEQIEAVRAQGAQSIRFNDAEALTVEVWR